jgi:hypothetical protein
MRIKGQILNQVIKYLSTKLAENNSFQRLSLMAHGKIETLRREGLEHVVNPNLGKNSAIQMIHRLIESGKSLLRGR